MCMRRTEREESDRVGQVVPVVVARKEKKLKDEDADHPGSLLPGCRLSDLRYDTQDSI